MSFPAGRPGISCGGLQVEDRRLVEPARLDLASRHSVIRAMAKVPARCGPRALGVSDFDSLGVHPGRPLTPYLSSPAYVRFALHRGQAPPGQTLGQSQVPERTQGRRRYFERRSFFSSTVLAKTSFRFSFVMPATALMVVWFEGSVKFLMTAWICALPLLVGVGVNCH